jgi:hypothetical protein
MNFERIAGMLIAPCTAKRRMKKFPRSRLSIRYRLGSSNKIKLPIMSHLVHPFILIPPGNSLVYKSSVYPLIYHPGMKNRSAVPARKLDRKLTPSLFSHKQPLVLTVCVPQWTAASVEDLQTGHVNSTWKYAPATVSRTFPRNPAALIRMKSFH